jgi:hypothetical protein
MFNHKSFYFINGLASAVFGADVGADFTLCKSRFT